MKLRKLFGALAASAVAVSAMAASASATLAVVENAPAHISSGTGMWMAKIYCPSEGIDFGIDPTAIETVKIQIAAADTDFFEGMFGGAVVMSCGPASLCPEDHNWASSDYWGCIDTDLGIETQNADSKLLAETLGNYTYQLTLNVDDTNCFYSIDSPDAYYQIAIQEWGQDMSDIIVKGMQCLDASGNVVIAFEGDGSVVTGAVEEAPVIETPAPADEAPATGDVSAETDSTKGSPDTGVADVAAVAGLALVAGGAFIVAKKRK